METIQDRVVAAAKELEDALNMIPKQLDVEVQKIDCSTLDSGVDYRFSIRITSTHPVQIYP